MANKKNKQIYNPNSAPVDIDFDRPGNVTLADCLLAKSACFASLGKSIETPPGAGELIHIDNGSNVLAVAHLDFVMFNRAFKNMHGKVTQCPQLDDRLGAFVILQQLYGIVDEKYDILLTDDEEIGQSTAQYFRPPRKYNWMFEFDRRGAHDFVTYKYGNRDFEDQLGKHLKMCSKANGSFTDICYLEHLGCAGVNVSVGYYGAHTIGCNAVLGETWRNVSDFAEFYRDNKGKHFNACLNSDWSRKSTVVRGYSPTAGNAGNPYSRLYIPDSLKSDEDDVQWTIQDLEDYGLLGAIDEHDNVRFADWYDSDDSFELDGSLNRCKLCGENTTQISLCSECQDDAINMADSWFWSQSFKVKGDVNEHSTWRH